MYDIDLFDTDASVISSLHSQGRVVICYFSTQYENWRPDQAEFTAAVLGDPLDDWPGERYVDITSDVVRDIMTARLDLAVSKGCDGVEPDNVDEYTNENGLGITAADQLNFNRFIATEAHSRGLSVGLKNDLDQVESLVTYFDWVLDEQCNEFDECNTLQPFEDAGKAVFGAEYSGTASKICPIMVADKYSWLFKDLDLDAQVTQCCTFAPNGCVDAPFSCVDVTSKRAQYDDTHFLAAIADDAVAAAVRASANPDAYSAAAGTFPTVATVFAVAAALVMAF